MEHKGTSYKFQAKKAKANKGKIPVYCDYFTGNTKRGLIPAGVVMDRPQ